MRRSLHGSAWVAATADSSNAAPWVGQKGGSGFAPLTGPTQIVQPPRDSGLLDGAPGIVAGGHAQQSRQPTSHYAVPTPANNYDQGPSALDKASKFFFMTEIFRGMAVVMEQFFRPPFTIMYPFEKNPQSPRFRGEHALRRYATGEERCVRARSHFS